MIIFETNLTSAHDTVNDAVKIYISDIMTMTTAL